MSASGDFFFSTATLFSKWQFVTFKRCFLCLVYKSKNKFLEVRVNLWLGMTTPQSLQNYAFFTARWSDDIVAVFDRLFCYYQVFQGFNFVTLIGKNPRNDKKLNSILYNDSLKNVQLFWKNRRLKFLSFYFQRKDPRFLWTCEFSLLFWNFWFPIQ